MIKQIILSLFFIFLTTNIFSQNTVAKENEILTLVLKTLKEKHISPKKIDDDFSRKMFKIYIDSLDTAKIFLLQSDIDEFKEYETKLDDQIQNNDFTFFNLTIDRIKKRSIEGKEIYSNILKNQLDFTTNDEDSYLLTSYDYSLDRKLSFAKNKTELIKKWHLLLKSYLLENVRKDFFFNNKNPLTVEVLFEEKKQTFEKFLEGTIFNYENNTRDFYFWHFVNSLVKQFDEDSKYFDPRARNKYIFEKTGKFEGSGIGVHLIDNFIQVKSLMEGGPAWKTKKIEVGDAILKIKQENEGPINVIGFNHFEVSKLLRGKAGTTVSLTLKKINGNIEDVQIKREVVAKNDYYLKSCIVTKNKINYGVLCFSQFYNELYDEEGSNVSDDFEKELETLKKEKVTGLVLDLRDNNGGSIEVAVKIIGNFIARSLVVQIIQKNKKTVLETINDKKNWYKNIVLITNSETKGAAELIAAAFKNHNIGVIIGEKTFGKATEQDFFDLNKIKTDKNSNSDFGGIKVTTDKNYRLDGKSFENDGIIPDIVMLEAKDVLKKTNSVNPSLRDVLKSVAFKPILPKEYYSNIINRNDERIKKSKNFKTINNFKLKELEYFVKRDKLKTLNFEKFKKEANQLLILKKELSLDLKKNSEKEFYLPSDIIKMLKNKAYLQQQRENWLNEIQTDFQIDEGLNILEDMNKLK